MSSLSTTLLYTASIVSAVTVLAHTKMGVDTVFPSLTKVPTGGLRDVGAGAARIGWLEVNQGFITQAILCAKWAKFGVQGPYDQALLGMFTITQLIASVSYWRLGARDAATLLVGVPTLVVLSQVL